MSDQSSQLFPAELRQMTQLIFGFMTSQAIAVAAKLGIADLLKEEPRTAEELANATKAQASSLNRLLRLLTSVGIFAEDANGKFQQTPLSELLRSDHPRSTQAFAIMSGSEFFWRPWGELHAAVMSGRSAFEHVFGARFFEHLAAHPNDAEVFNAGMTSASINDAAAVVAAYDFSRFDRVVDVGGGHGALLRAILSANPKLRGVLADRPAVVAGAEALRTGAMADRCEFTVVDFFSSVPGGADAYIMRWIIHDWNDEDSLKILRNCRRAIRSDGTLLIVDAVLKPPNEPDPGKLMDLNMLVLAPGGRERTEADFAALLRQADFSLTRVIPTAGTLSIIESRPS
jgi:SAM-dependent methyltransferase